MSRSPQDSRSVYSETMQPRFSGNYFSSGSKTLGTNFPRSRVLQNVLDNDKYSVYSSYADSSAETSPLSGISSFYAALPDASSKTIHRPASFKTLGHFADPSQRSRHTGYTYRHPPSRIEYASNMIDPGMIPGHHASSSKGYNVDQYVPISQDRSTVRRTNSYLSSQLSPKDSEPTRAQGNKHSTITYRSINNPLHRSHTNSTSQYSSVFDMNSYRGDSVVRPYAHTTATQKMRNSDTTNIDRPTLSSQQQQQQREKREERIRYSTSYDHPSSVGHRATQSGTSHTYTDGYYAYPKQHTQHHTRYAFQPISDRNIVHPVPPSSLIQNPASSSGSRTTRSAQGSRGTVSRAMDVEPVDIVSQDELLRDKGIQPERSESRLPPSNALPASTSAVVPSFVRPSQNIPDSTTTTTTTEPSSLSQAPRVRRSSRSAGRRQDTAPNAQTVTTGAYFEQDSLDRIEQREEEQRKRSDYGDSDTRVDNTTTSTTAYTARTRDSGTNMQDEQYSTTRRKEYHTEILAPPVKRSSSVATRATRQRQEKAGTMKHLSLPFVGFQNLGNTCYLNSSLQALMPVTQFLYYFATGTWVRDRNPNSEGGGRLASAFQSLLEEIQRSAQRSRSTQGDMRYYNAPVIAPVHFKESLSVFSALRCFRGYNQHDAQEFIRFFLDALSEETNHNARNKLPYRVLEAPPHMTNVQVANDWWEYYLSRNSSPLVQFFCGQMRSQRICDECKYNHRAFDPFWDLSLSLPQAGQVSSKYGTRGSSTSRRGDVLNVYDCLDAFNKPEHISSQDSARCEGCKANTSSIRKIDLFRTPQVLLLHLKRFAYGTFRRGKIGSPVSFPIDSLDLSPYVADDVRHNTKHVYQLASIVHHSGSTGGGHYIASVRTGPNSWIQANDSRLTDISNETLSPSASAYLLVYIKQ